MNRADFEKRYPHFDVAALDDYWEVVKCDIKMYYGGSCLSSDCDGNAIEYLVMAHLLTLYIRAGATSGKPIIHGQITSKSVDGVSVSYAQAVSQSETTHAHAFWRSTPYGELFLVATQGCSMGAYFV